jgi:hypothetical protein
MYSNDAVNLLCIVFMLCRIFKDEFSQVQCAFTCTSLADGSHMLCSYVSCIITTQYLINLIAALVEMELILQLDLTGLSFLP